MDVFALAFLFLLKHFDRAVYPQQPIAGCRHINRQNYGWVQQSFPLNCGFTTPIAMRASQISVG